MKIVILSDLNWEHHLRSVTISEVQKVNLDTVRISRYYSIARYLDIVIQEKAGLVLISGDVTGDGSCGHGFQNAFLILLSMLDKLSIPSCFISGNHDEPGYYQQVEAYIHNFKNCHEISNQVVEVNGVKILGVPYEATYSKSKIKNLLSEFDDDYDIVLAHSQLKRRIRLFELNAKYIITGHYDRKLFGHRNSVFISLDNDAENVSYAVLNTDSEKAKISINIKQDDGVHLKLEESRHDLISDKRPATTLFINNKSSHRFDNIELQPDSKLVDDYGNNLVYLKYIRGTEYKTVLARMEHIKSKPELKPTLEVAANIIGKKITESYSVSASLVVDYLGKRTR